MPRSHTSEKSKHHNVLDLMSFEQSIQGDEAANELALAVLHEAALCGTISQWSEVLLSRANLYEYVFSIVNDATATIMREYLFQDHISDNQSSLTWRHATVLERLSKFIYFLPYATDNDKPSDLIKNYQFVHASQDILRSLSQALFGQAGHSCDDDNDDGFFKPAKKGSINKQSQRKTKQKGRSRNVIPQINPTSFRTLGKDVPSTGDEARSLARELVLEQTILLRDFLDTLRQPSLSTMIRQQYIPRKVESQGVTSRIISKIVESVPDETPAVTSAFPIVQPLRAALYFESAKGFGDWRIFISTQAEKDLRGHMKNPKTFNVIVKKIKELSHGHFSSDNQKRLKGNIKSVPIFEAKLTGDLRLVYQVDYVSDYETEGERQALRVYGIFTHAQMDARMWESLSAHLAVNKGPEYNQRVRFRAKPLIPGDNVYPPGSWPSIEQELQVNDPITSAIRPDDLQEIHQWVILEKYMAFSQALFNCILTNKYTSPIFAVSSHEKEIIENTESCYVLGRSGTGKTTTMLFKIFGIERSALQQCEALPSKPRQLFVTQSRVLTSRVEEYYKNLTEFLKNASKNTAEVADILAHNQEEDIMEQRNEALVDEDEEDEWRDDLPKRFSDLEDKHFPLFLTFDKLCRLLEADLGLSFAHQKYTKEHKRAETRFNLNHIAQDSRGLDESDLDDEEPVPTDEIALEKIANDVSTSLVSFELFQQSYWPRFPQDRTKRLDPALVFSEFIGVIKGSEQTLTSQQPYLSREDYINLSCRNQATFAKQRERIYDLFEAYLKLKRQRGDYDAADRTHELLKRLNTEKLTLMDYLYVDEAQDNLLVDTLLLRSLCKNSNGIFWAGDTAQTIAIGSSFRFNELKAFMHRVEERLYSSQYAKFMIRPKLFQLTMNYRSHGGIVNCADSIVQLITRFWPDSIDVLQREQGVVNGAKPVFLEGWENGTLRMDDFLFGESGNMVEFGAQQCILVRHDAARDELRKAVGEIGLILTLYESKGLEFDDVLLYNFFKDSPSDVSQWRLVLNAIEDVQNHAVPQFDDIRHASINSELKFLYVAVTRARKNLWIADCSEKGHPMKTLLLSRNQIDLRTPATMPRLAVSSSTEQWTKAGYLDFKHKRYSQAIHCFKRAGLDHERDISEAYDLRRKAMTISVLHGHKQSWKYAFLAAANMFLRCARAMSRTNSQITYYRIAAECFLSAEDHGAAAHAYAQAEMFTLAAQHYRSAGMFDEAVGIVRTKAELIDSNIVKKIVDVAKLYYFKEQKIDKALYLFDSYEDSLEFTQDYDLDVQEAVLLEKMGRKTQAAEVHLSEGRLKDAIRLFFSDSTNPFSVGRAVECILRSLWDTFSFGVNQDVGQQDQSIGVEFLNRAIGLHTNLIKPGVILELRVFDAIRKSSLIVLPGLILELYNDYENIPATLLALDHYFTSLDNRTFHAAEDVVSFLELGCMYAKLLRNIVLDTNACDSVDLQKLFRIQALSDFEFSISSGCLLHTQALNQSKDPNKIPRFSLMRLITDAILGPGGRLHRVANDQIRVCSRSRFFATPCIRFLVYRLCNPPGGATCQDEHLPSSSIDCSWLNQRFQILCQQIIFLQAIDFVPLLDLRIRQRDCMISLFEILYPPAHALGGVAYMSPNKIPNFEKAMQILHTWLEGQSYELNFWNAPRWFLNAVVQITELALYLDPSGISAFIQRSSFFKAYRPPPALLRNNNYVVHELVQSLAVTDGFFVAKGICALKHIIETRLHIDINYTCCILEFLSASTIFLTGYKRRNLHDITMPKSWFSTVVRRISVLYCELKYTGVLANLLKDLIAQFMIGTDLSHFIGISTLTRNVCVHRLFRCLCLLGYNNHMRDQQARYDIVNFIKQLRMKPVDIGNPLYRSFSQACTWPDLARAVRDSCLGSDLDEMVQIVQEDRINASFRPPRNVRCMVFKVHSDIAMFFNRGLRKDSIFPQKLSADATPFIPRFIRPDLVHHYTASSAEGLDSLEATSAETLEGVNEHEITEHDNEDGADDDDSSESEEDFNGAVTALNIAPVVPTEEENWAARSIQAMFRKRLAQRNAKPSPLLHEKRARHFITYLEQAKRMEWASGCLYRFLFLGPLPHLLLSVDTLLELIMAMKKNAKLEFKKSSHHKLEEFGEQITHANELLSECHRLRNMAEPSSKFHRRRDLSKLRGLVIDVQALVERLNTQQVAEDMHLAMKAIVQERKVTLSVRPKPMLNVDSGDSDLSEDMYDYY